MIVEQYGVKYYRVTENDLELIRYWRNQEFIRDTMQFKNYISPPMQKSWFHNINNRFNYYFIIVHEGKKIGLINCKDSGPDTRIAEGGIFIWDKTYWGTPVPAFAALTMLQAVFEIFKSGEASVATVACHNKAAIDFNLLLGYEIKDKTPDGNYYKLLLTMDNYLLKTKKFLKASKIFSGNNSEFKLISTVSDTQADEINEYILKQKNN